jgi:hypothetical protein
MMGNNIFSALAKYNSAIDENYLTESFVFLVNELLRKDLSIAVDLLNFMCVTNDEFCFQPGERIRVSTQEVTEQGQRPAA